MNIVVHGNTSFAWTAALQMSALGHSVILCPAWCELIILPDSEVSRELGLADLLESQLQSGRFQLARGVDFVDANVAAVEQHWMAIDGKVCGLLEQCEALLAAACQRPAATTLPLFGVLTAFPIGTLSRLSEHLLAVLADSRRQAELNGRAFPQGRPSTFALPLFIRAGSSLKDFLSPSLLLIGCTDNDCRDTVLETLRPIVRRAAKVKVVTPDAAEVIKSSVNGMLATRMSFMNEVALLCEKLNVDVEVVRQGIAADPRVGQDYLEPGCGFGGPSFSGEVINFSHTLNDTLGRRSLIETVMDINVRQREELFRKIWRYFQGDLKGRCFAIWGAAYKPGSASVQDSAVHPLLEALWAQGAHTCVYDPLAGSNLAAQYPDQPLLTVASTASMALQGCAELWTDALILVTAWDEFQALDFALLRRQLRQPVIFDGRNVYDPVFMRNEGFTYIGIGRGAAV